jgi:hypothetical protein
MDDPTEDEERLAEELAEEAVAELDPLMTRRERSAIKERLIDELLFTEAGRLKLRAAGPPPVVDRSAELARTSDGREPRKKASS